MLEEGREGLPNIICHNRHRTSMSSRQGPGHTKGRPVQKYTPSIHLSQISSKYHLISLTVKGLISQVLGKPSPATKCGQIRPSFVKIKTPHKCGRFLNLYFHTYFFLELAYFIIHTTRVLEGIIGISCFTWPT